ncbi:MAG TPA: TadE family protein [Candidatus Acidoferrales bacterium]|nr:TadE family protein [Candidatus Acidoferrales bacterium]
MGSASVRSSPHTPCDECGQSLVEFALLLPVVMLIVVGIFEFGMMLNSRNSVEFASRDASVLASEGGNLVGTDCVVLDKVERDIVSPARNIRITSISVYWSDKNGDQIGNNVNVYTRSGSMTCSYGNGASLTVPYTLTTPNYLEGARCDVLAGCGGSHPGLDIVGVRITYQHSWITTLVQQTGTITFSVATATRIEPQQ